MNLSGKDLSKHRIPHWVPKGRHTRKHTRKQARKKASMIQRRDHPLLRQFAWMLLWASVTFACMTVLLLACDHVLLATYEYHKTDNLITPYVVPGVDPDLGGIEWNPWSLTCLSLPP